MALEDSYDLLFKVVLIGDSAVGKTNILSKYLKNEFHNESKATVGVEFGAKIFEIEGRTIKAQIWDTAGQERYKSITNAYYKGAKGALIIYDITRRDTFDSVDKWIANLKGVADKKITILIIGNKCDLKNQRTVSHEQGKEKARAFNVAFMETSAYNGENVAQAFNIMAKEVYNKCKAELIKEDHNDFENLKIGKELNLNTNKKENKKCC